MYPRMIGMVRGFAKGLAVHERGSILDRRSTEMKTKATDVEKRPGVAHILITRVSDRAKGQTYQGTVQLALATKPEAAV